MRCTYSRYHSLYTPALTRDTSSQLRHNFTTAIHNSNVLIYLQPNAAEWITGPAEHRNKLHAALPVTALTEMAVPASSSPTNCLLGAADGSTSPPAPNESLLDPLCILSVFLDNVDLLLAVARRRLICQTSEWICFNPEDKGNMSFRNVGNIPHFYMVPTSAQ